jgi:hypothetical protein
MTSLLTKSKSYTELENYKTFGERYQYLRLTGIVGDTTFGFDRYLNQLLYNSREWRNARDEVLIRDDGGDLGLYDYPIRGRVIVHHMNPISLEDVKSGDRSVYNPEFLICVSHATHLALHYGDESLLLKDPIVRRPNDTCPWR